MFLQPKKLKPFIALHLGIGIVFLFTQFAYSSPVMIDVHVHYNWDQEELVSPQEAIEILKKHNIEMAVVFSTPTENALKLRKLGGDSIIPFFSPYITGYSRNNWFRDKRVLSLAKKGLEQGHYFGIGETHLVPGIGPRRDNEIFQGLLMLADEYNVPFLIHTEAADYRYLKPICEQHPDVRFLWAHAGGILGPEHSQGILQACQNVWIEVSARDGHHYGGLIDDEGRLRQEWKDTFVKYADRFMVGTDPVWNAHQVNRWYEADEGWLNYDKFYSFHQQWLSQLPDEVAHKIRYANARKFFRYAYPSSGR